MAFARPALPITCAGPERRSHSRSARLPRAKRRTIHLKPPRTVPKGHKSVDVGKHLLPGGEAEPRWRTVRRYSSRRTPRIDARARGWQVARRGRETAMNPSRPRSCRDPSFHLNSCVWRKRSASATRPVRRPPTREPRARPAPCPARFVVSPECHVNADLLAAFAEEMTDYQYSYVPMAASSSASRRSARAAAQTAVVTRLRNTSSIVRSLTIGASGPCFRRSGDAGASDSSGQRRTDDDVHVRGGQS